MLSTHAKRKLSLTATIIVCLTGPIWATFELCRYIYIGGLDFLLEPPGLYFIGGWFFLMGLVATFCYVPVQCKTRTTSDDLESAGQEREMRISTEDASKDVVESDSAYSSALER